jgi:LysM repeat protein
MKKRGRLGCWLGFGALALVLLCAAAVAVVYSQVRARAFASRPLVLIHSPINHEQAQFGEGMLVHATARSARGVKRMELWVDDLFIAARDNPTQGPASPLVISESWTPSSMGSHVLVVHAVSADGVDGQATIIVEAVGEEAATLGGHTVQAGETVASIAEEHGVSPEELGRLNPDVGSGGVAPGDDLTVPGGEEASEEPPADSESAPQDESAVEEPAPNPEEAPPGDFLHVLLSVIAVDFGAAAAPSDEPLSLRIEALSIQTDAAYEGVHCYIGMADALPRWYPDADGDQTTDESFAASGDRMWNVAEHLSGEAAPVITWPGNQNLSLDATCVGVQGGGTEAVELGRLLLEIPPSAWDGVSRWSPVVSNEGSFSLEYRVGPAAGGGVTIGLDPSMTPPTNLTLSSTVIFGNSLYWSYEPRPDEEPIDGFRIYLNGTLLWVEPADARTTTLPNQWMFPCAEPYTFTVTAFRGTYPDGPESTPSEPPVVIEAEPAHCQRVVYVTFLNLTTHELGGDGSREDRSGDVGPIYGSVYANDGQVGLDGRAGGWGLTDNSQYVIRDLVRDWGGSSPAQLRIELAEQEALEVGFRLKDADTGFCHDSGDTGCDDLVCEAEVLRDVDIDTTPDVRTIVSHNGRCEMTYTLGLGAGFPAEAYGGELPLPWLTVDEVTMAENSQIRIHVRNSGRSAWPSREVKAAIVRPTGEAVTTLSWPDISLEPGETTILQYTTMDFGPLPVCAILDPANEVGEWGDALETAGVIQAHAPVCMKLPDLVINDVEYDPGAGHLLVTVQNQGEGRLDNRTLNFKHGPLDAEPTGPFADHPSITLEPGASSVLPLTIAGTLGSERPHGYVVKVDPDDLVEESNDENNSYAVPAGTQLRINWTHITAPWQARNRVEFELRAYVVSAGSRTQVVDWRLSDIDWDSCTHDLTHGECFKIWQPDTPYESPMFPIDGDEALEINVTATHSMPLEDDFGHTFTWLAVAESYTASDGWGAGDYDPTNRSCDTVDEGPGDHGWTLGRYSEWAPTLGYYHDWQWYVNFNVCK